MTLVQRVKTFLSHAPGPYYVLLGFLREVWLICAHLPLIFYETPDEIAARNRKAAEERDDWVYMTVETPFGQIEERYMNSSAKIPPGHVLVKLYRDLECLWQDSAVMATLPLEEDGGLNLRPLRLKWNLENCYPVDSSRAEIFETIVDERLSPLAVMTLTENQLWLRVVEMPSQRVQYLRALRLGFIAAYSELTQVLRASRTVLVHLHAQVLELLYDFKDFPADLQEVLRETRCRVLRSVQGDPKECHDHTFCKCHNNSRPQEATSMPRSKI